MNNHQKVTICLKNGKFQPCGTLNTPTLQAESIFTDFKISYNVECKSLADQNSVSSAIKMAQEKHCGMITMLRKIAPVSHDIAIVSTETV